jgi:hypothetical protein
MSGHLQSASGAQIARICADSGPLCSRAAAAYRRQCVRRFRRGATRSGCRPSRAGEPGRAGRSLWKNGQGRSASALGKPVLRTWHFVVCMPDVVPLCGVRFCELTGAAGCPQTQSDPVSFVVGDVLANLCIPD